MSSKLPDFSFARHLPAASIGGTRITGEDHIHLSYGFPASDLLPISQLNQAAEDALQWNRRDALHYSGAGGPVAVRDWVLHRLRTYDIHAEPAHYLATYGAIQGIDLAARVLVDPGDSIWVESPTFFNALQSFRVAGASIRAFPVDADGLDVERVEEALRQAIAERQPLPKLVYVMPNYHNPTGVSLTLERRRHLARLAYEYNFFILEDDAYVELNFNGQVLPSLYSLAPERVIYLGTFSKTLGPGLRLGWVIAPAAVIQHMRTLMLGSQSSPFAQEIIGQLLSGFAFDEHVGKLIARYTEQRNVMTEALERELGDHVHYHVPAGGFFLWLSFPESIRVQDVSPLALQRGVSFVEGPAFFVQPEGFRHARLCFSYSRAEQIDRGIRLLAEAYFEHLRQRPAAVSHS